MVATPKPLFTNFYVWFVIPSRFRLRQVGWLNWVKVSEMN